MRIFSGKRSDVITYYKDNTGLSEEDIGKKLLTKNPASLAIIRIKKIIYHFFMRENGGKMMKLYIGTVKINDYREKSLLKKNTRIVFNLDD